VLVPMSRIQVIGRRERSDDVLDALHQMRVLHVEVRRPCRRPA
jgi:vacuolar-type H+-ATPase subunit I/STV1